MVELKNVSKVYKDGETRNVVLKNIDLVINDNVKTFLKKYIFLIHLFYLSF